MLARLFALLCAVVASSSSAAQGIQTAVFSWRAQLGEQAADFLQTIGSFAVCASAAPLEFSLAAHPKKFFPGNWHLPMGGGIVGLKASTSRVIKEISCTVKDQAHIKTMVHAGAVFQIEIKYLRCAPKATLRPADCNYTQKEYDRAIFQSLSTRPFYGPVGAVNNDEAKRYFEMTAQISDEYLKFKISEAAFCSLHVFDRSKQEVNCIFEISQSEGIWHSVSMAELIEKGWFNNTAIARLAARQEFALVHAEKLAIAAFEAEAATILEERQKIEANSIRQEQNRRVPLQSIR